MLAAKTLIVYTALFSPYDFNKNDQIILSYFKDAWSRYVTVFDYIDKILVILSAKTGGISIILFTTAIGAPVRIASASFTLTISLSTGIIKKSLNITRKKKKAW